MERTLLYIECRLNRLNQNPARNAKLIAKWNRIYRRKLNAS